MGLAISTIRFDNDFPSLEAIQAQFFRQTGLNLWVTANLKIDRINLPYTELISLLTNDAPEVHRLQIHYQNVKQADPQNYEKLAWTRDQTYLGGLSSLNYLTQFQFNISQFYELDFRIQDNVIEIESYVGQYYGIISLNKTLIDLGGKFDDGGEGYPGKWKNLKKWHEYKWYNKPRK